MRWKYFVIFLKMSKIEIDYSPKYTLQPACLPGSHTGASYLEFANPDADVLADAAAMDASDSHWIVCEHGRLLAGRRWRNFCFFRLIQLLLPAMVTDGPFGVDDEKCLICKSKKLNGLLMCVIKIY